MKLAIVIVSTLLGMAAALPSPQPESLEARRSRKKEETYTGAQIVSVLATRQNKTLSTREPQRGGPGGPGGPGGGPGGPQAPSPREDPNLCYADCILSGGGDWQCICDCVDCGGASSR